MEGYSHMASGSGKQNENTQQRICGVCFQTESKQLESVTGHYMHLLHP